MLPVLVRLAHLSVFDFWDWIEYFMAALKDRFRDGRVICLHTDGYSSYTSLLVELYVFD